MRISINSASEFIISAAVNLVNIPKLLVTGFPCKYRVKLSGSGKDNREPLPGIA
jgi:hypothetical protein